MTQKELLYLEDAFNHEKYIIDICNNISINNDDSKLVNFIDKEIKHHDTMKNKIYKFLEGKSNE